LTLKPEDQIEEQIRFNTEIIKFLAVTLIATLSGVLALVISRGSTAVENLFTAGGMIVAVICIGAIFRRYSETRKMIDDGSE
jgi:hypothetical protein